MRGLAMPGHWHKQKPENPSEQTYEFDRYQTEVAAVILDAAEIEQQLAHAKEQLALTRQYPGRDPERPRAKVITFKRP
jgi:hypothetical protein